jgi:hypothetical protein
MGIARSSVGAACLNEGSFRRLENITPIKRDAVPLEKSDVFFLKGFSTVARRLILDVIRYTTHMRMRNRKRAEAFLPRESASHPLLLVNVIGRTSFDVTDQIRWRDVWFQTEQQVRVIRHAKDGN